MFLLYSLVIGLGLGLVLRGRLSSLGEIPFRWAPLALLGLVWQIVLFSPPVTATVGDLGPPLYIASTLLVLLVVVRNMRVAPGLGLVAAGTICNLTAIAANGGFMPTEPGALAAAGRAATVGYSNSVDLLRPALEPLVDRYATPSWLPFANVFSVGDVLIGLGIAFVIVLAMVRGRSGQPDRPRPARPPQRNQDVTTVALGDIGTWNAGPPNK